jgi:hypothetical protein
MSLRTALAVILVTLASAAGAQEQAFTNRSTELKDRGANDARTLATLPENTSVKVLARGGGWTRVEAAGQSGWLNVFHLRFPATTETGSSGGFLSGATSFIGGGRNTSQKATIATTGIRGLSPEDIKNASPDTAALAKVQSYRADKSTAERFAREGKLAAVSIDYVGDSAKGGRK